MCLSFSVPRSSLHVPCKVTVSLKDPHVSLFGSSDHAPSGPMPLLTCLHHFAGRTRARAVAATSSAAPANCGALCDMNSRRDAQTHRSAVTNAPTPVFFFLPFLTCAPKTHKTKKPFLISFFLRFVLVGGVGAGARVPTLGPLECSPRARHATCTSGKVPESGIFLYLSVSLSRHLCGVCSFFRLRFQQIK